MLNSAGEELFFVHFLRRSQADQEDANVFQKMIEKCSKIMQNPAFWRPCFGPSSWRGSRVIIFRLLAIEKLSWNFFFRVLVDFRQFLGSQNGLNFDLKMALKSSFCWDGLREASGRPPGAILERFWLDFGCSGGLSGMIFRACFEAFVGRIFRVVLGVLLGFCFELLRFASLCFALQNQS